MKQIISYLLIGATLFINTSQSKSPALKIPAKPYQDIIINNKVYRKGWGPDSSSRYEAIKKIICQFKRPITILDIGAAEGYMSFRLAHDFDATCVMIADPNTLGFYLPKLCEYNTNLDNTIVLHRRIPIEELEHLSNCEHFDVVLALNIIHHFKDKWKRAAQAILKLGDIVIIETPPVEDKRCSGQKLLPKIISFVESHNAKVITKTERIHTAPGFYANTYFLKGGKKYKKRHWLDNHIYEIHSNFNERYLIEKNESTTIKHNWPQGIGLLTFKMLHGSYPKLDLLKKSIISKKTNHFLMPQNIILQGKNIAISNFFTLDTGLYSYISDDIIASTLYITKTQNKNVVSATFNDIKDIINPI